MVKESFRWTEPVSRAAQIDENGMEKWARKRLCLAACSVHVALLELPRDILAGVLLR
jgi:hypothetical protein